MINYVEKVKEKVIKGDFNSININELITLLEPKDYFEILENALKYSLTQNNKIQAQLCSIYMYSYFESNIEKFNNFSNDDENISLNKGDYEMMMNQIKFHQLRFKRYERINILISFLTETFIFLILYFGLSLELIYSVLLTVVLFTIDLFVTKRTNHKRFEKNEIKVYQKEVNPVLLNLINKGFKSLHIDKHDITR
ncbi:MAG: hypothetical protein VB122_00925 [Erysipelotrichales bacterium]|nr:hypothetical protein [Erysipelotrichales bacterium]